MVNILAEDTITNQNDLGIGEFHETAIGVLLVSFDDSVNNNISIFKFGSIYTNQRILDESRSQEILQSFTPFCGESKELPGYSFYCKPQYKKNIFLDSSKNKTIEKLMQISELQDGWDGEDARAFDPSLIKKVFNLVIEMNYQPEIFPTACDTIQMEYEDEKNGSYLELEISDADDIKVFSIDKMGQERTDSLEATSQRINEMVESFHEREFSR